MELVKGVYQITLPLEDIEPEQSKRALPKVSKEDFVHAIEQTVRSNQGLSAINTYLIEGKKENLLIDTGWDSPEAYSLLFNELKKFGFDIKDIHHIVVTHIHPDHYGLAGKIKQLSGGKVAYSDIEASMVDSRYITMEPLLKEISEMLYANGAPEEMVADFSKLSLPARRYVMPVLPDIRLKDGKKISIEPFEFKVLITPGHSPGHVCLYEQNRKLLFCGDQILPEITPNISYHPQSGANPLGDYLKSLNELLKLEVRLAFPGHGPTFSGLRQRITELMRHHEQRNNKIMATITTEIKTAYQIASEIPWLNETDESNFKYLDEFGQRLAIMETAAHLQYLLKQNEIMKIEKNGIFYYRTV